jgi:hypothetical protein
MSVQESSATVLVRFTGLGIVCFNDDQQRGEIGVIRDQKHTLAIKIQRPVFQEGAESDAILYEDVAVYENLPKENVEIEFSVEQPAIAGYEIYQPGDFDRLTSTDLNDFRWIVNFDNLHDGSTVPKAAADKYPLTKIYVPHALFYTHRLDQNLFFEKVEKDATGAEQQRESFGNIGETIGAKIEGSLVKVTLRIAGKEESHSLARVEGLPYVVRIVNMDQSANAVYSDMPDYYKYVASPTGVQVDLAPVIEDGGDQRVKGGAVNQDDFCHPIIIGLSSIDEL